MLLIYSPFMKHFPLSSVLPLRRRFSHCSDSINPTEITCCANTRCFTPSIAYLVRIILFVALITLLLGLILPCEAWTESPKDKVTQRIEKQWAGFASAISTSHLRCRVVRKTPDRQVSRQEVEIALAKHPITQSADVVYALSDELHLGIERDKPPWSNLEIWTKGKQTRQEETYDGHPVNVIIDNGSEELYLKPLSHQVQVYPRGRCRMRIYTPFAFLIVPVIKSTTSIEVLSQPAPNILAVQLNGQIYHADSASGFITGVIKGNGGRLREEYQAIDIVTFQDNITFPRCVMQIAYLDNLLSTFDLTFIEDAHFNESVPDERFLLAIDAPTNAFDYRKNISSSKFLGQISSTTNVVAEINKRIANVGLSSGSGRQIIIIANAVVLALLLCLWIYFRMRHRLRFH